MKRILIIFVIVSICSFSLLSKATIKFKQTNINFGEIDQGKVVKVDFEFENVGDSVLIIDKVHAPCGCTTVKWEKKEYKPGEKGIIPIQFNSRQYHGKVSKSALVYTNDQENATVKLELSGEIILKYFSVPEIETENLDFIAAQVGKRYERTIKIKNTGTSDLKIIDLIHDPEIIPEFSRHIITPNSEAELVVTFKPMEPSKTTKWLRLRTDSFKRRQILIKINTQAEK